jgi:hypothetical protein
MRDRHPQGRTCSQFVPLVVLLMPYALFRYWRDERRTRRASGR